MKTAQVIPPIREARRLDIQGLRAIAVGVVVAFHAGLPLPGGFVGVDVFFVISGFVITTMLQREWDRDGNLRLGRFYLRRFKRLTPALATVLVVVVIVTALVGPLNSSTTAPVTALGAIALIANVVIAETTGGYFDAAAGENPLLHTWSLSVEEQFYLAFPTLILIAWRWTRNLPSASGRRAVWLAVAICSGLLLAATLYGATRSSWMDSTWLGFYSPLLRFWEFGAGVLVAIVPSRGWAPSPPIRGLLGWGGLTMIAASCWLIHEGVRYPSAWTLLPVVGTSAVIIGGLSGDGAVSRLLSAGPLVTVGDWSYSLYLWHWPMIVLGRYLSPAPWTPVVAAVLSLLPAYLSFRWLEQPLRAWSPPSRRSLALLVALVVVPPVAISALALVAARANYWMPAVDSRQKQVVVDHLGFQRGCDLGRPLGQAGELCSWNATSKGRPTYLVGDSNADQFTEAVLGATETLGRPLTIATSNGCPFVEIRYVRRSWSPDRNEACSA